MNEMFPYAQMFRRFAIGICRHPSQLVIREAVPDQRKIILFVTASNADAGFLCGPGCRTIKALQTIFRAIAGVAGHHITINVQRNENKFTDHEPLFKVKETWDGTPELMDLLTTCLEAMGLKDIEAVSEEHHDTTIVTIKSPDLPGQLMSAFNEALNEWGKGQGRRIMILTPSMVRAA
jgi:predicted RNA-binding protein YlqC (UPF0109 family)